MHRVFRKKKVVKNYAGQSKKKLKKIRIYNSAPPIKKLLAFKNCSVIYPKRFNLQFR